MSNTRVVRIFKLVNSINIGLKKYDFAKVSIKKCDLFKIFIDLDNSKVSSNENKLPANIIATLSLDFIYQIKANNDGIPRLCAPYVGSKLAQIIGQQNSMTLITYKLKKVCIDL